MTDTETNPPPLPAGKEPEPPATPETNPPSPPAGKEPEPPAAAETPLELTDMNWEQNVERSDRPVAVMFYSPTCVFCRQIEPYFQGYARDYRETVRFGRLNIMSNAWTPERYGVRSTPTFKFFCEGKAVQEIVGAVYPAILKKIVEDVLVHGKECARNSTEINYDITGYG